MICGWWQDLRKHMKLSQRIFRLDIRKKLFTRRWLSIGTEVTASAWQSWRHVWAMLSGMCVLRCPCRARSWIQWSWWVIANSAYYLTVILWLTTECPTSILLAPCSAFWYFLKLSVFSSTLHLPPLYCCHQNRHSMLENLYSTKIIVLLIYLALRRKWGRKRVFFFSSYLRQYSGLCVPCMVFIAPVFFFAFHASVSTELKYLSWVGTGHG